MITETPKRRISKRQLLGGVAILVIFIVTAWFFTSGVFRDWVRRQIITTIEANTGGRASVNRIEWSLSKLELVLHDVTISGREPAGEAPFVHVERLYMRVRILSLLSRKMKLEYVEADHPVLHLITYPDGTTNEPVPTTPRTGSPVQVLFDWQLDRGEIHDGILFINNDAIPLDGSAEGVRAALNYIAGSHAFNGTVDITKLDLRYQDMRPFSASSHADFTLANNELTIRSLALSSGASALNGSGKLTNFADPHINFSFEGKLDMVQVAAVTRTPGVRGGVAQVNGNVTYYAGQYRATGTTEVQGAAYRAASTDIPGVNARANFVADNHGIQLNEVRGTALGGTFEGSIGVQEVLTRRGRLHEHTIEEHGTAQLRFHGFDVQKLESAMPRKERELQIQMRGSASGTVAAYWTGTPDKATAEIHVNVAPPTKTAAGEVPVTAAVHATYDGASGKLNVQQLQISSPGSRIEATGRLGTSGGELHLSVDTSNFAELQSALADLGIDFTVPAEIHGPVTFTGTVGGTREDPQVTGHIVANNVEYLAEFTAEALLTGAPHQAPATKPMRIHWDRITADLQYSSHAVSLRSATLQAGSSRDVISGSATLADGHIVPTSRIDLQANVENEDVQRVAALIGTRSPVQGQLSGSVRLSGTAGNPTGSGTARIANVPLGQQQAVIASAFTLRDHQVTFTNLNIARGPDHLTGTGSLNVATNAFSFSIHGGPIELASLPEVQSTRVSLAGVLTFTIQGSGTTSAPEINGRIHVANLVVNGESLGDLNSEASTRAGVMQISAATTAQTAQLAVNGTVRLQGDYTAALTMNFPHLDFDPLLRAYLKGRLTGHSLAVGSATVNGPLRNPRLLTVDANVEQFSVAIEKLDLKNVAPVKFRIANEVLSLNQFHIAGTNTDLTAAGTIPLIAGRSMAINTSGTIDLALIHTLNSNFSSAGKMMLDVRAEGTTAHPAMTGRVEVQNASIAYIDLPNGLSEVNGTLIFDQNRLVVQKLTGQSGGGALTLGGYVAYANGLSFALTARLQDMRLRYPPGVSTITNTDLHWTGSPTASTIAGELMLTRFNISPQFDFASYVARAGQPLPEVTVNSPLNNIRLDIHVVSAPALQVSTSLAKVSGDIDLRIRGTLADPSILGRVNILRGTIFFNGTNYQIQRGDITFLNPTTIDPVLNLDFTTRIAGYDINLSIDGPLDHLHTTYRSDPPLPSSDIISLLAFRQCPTSATFSCSPSAVEQAETYNASANPNFAEAASNQILGQALNATLSNRVQHLFGISRVKISPEVATTIGNPSARITVEQQVSNKVTITWVTDVAQAEQQVIQVVYNINRSFSIVAVRDQFGVASFDLRIRRRKR